MTGIDDLRAWIGRRETQEDVLTARLVDQYAATLGDHLYRQRDDAPPAIHWCLAPPATGMAELGEDGHPRTGGFLPPVPLPRRMWAGGSVETRAPLRVGDHVTRTSEITDIAAKSGRSGTLCFVTVTHRYETARGLAIVDRQDIVYREAATTGAAPPAPIIEGAPAVAADGWAIDTPPTLLFRYSALTFNAHRIHYDLPYATRAEGYAGLVVHGPLQASLLLNFCARRHGAMPRRFDYRGVAPVIAGSPFTIDGEPTETGMTCRTRNGQGGEGMRAEATW